MSRTSPILRISAFALLACLAAYGFWMYHREGLGGGDQPAYSVSANDIAVEFMSNDSLSHQKYYEKNVKLNGVVSKIMKVDSLWLITLEAKPNYYVSCMLHPDEKAHPRIEEEIILEGIYAGYLPLEEDFGLPGDVKFKNCFVH